MPSCLPLMHCTAAYGHREPQVDSRQAAPGRTVQVKQALADSALQLHAACNGDLSSTSSADSPGQSPDGLLSCPRLAPPRPQPAQQQERRGRSSQRPGQDKPAHAGVRGCLSAGRRRGLGSYGMVCRPGESGWLRLHHCWLLLCCSLLRLGSRCWRCSVLLLLPPASCLLVAQPCLQLLSSLLQPSHLPLHLC